MQAENDRLKKLIDTLNNVATAQMTEIPNQAAFQNELSPIQRLQDEQTQQMLAQEKQNHLKLRNQINIQNLEIIQLKEMVEQAKCKSPRPQPILRSVLDDQLTDKRIQELTVQLEVATQQIQTQEAEIRAQCDKHTAILQQQLQELQTGNRFLQAQYTEAKKKIQQLEDKESQRQKDIKNCTPAPQPVNQEVENLKKVVKNQDQRMAKYQQDIQKLKLDNEAALKAASEDLNAKIKENADLSEKLSIQEMKLTLAANVQKALLKRLQSIVGDPDESKYDKDSVNQKIENLIQKVLATANTEKQKALEATQKIQSLESSLRKEKKTLEQTGKQEILTSEKVQELQQKIFELQGEIQRAEQVISEQKQKCDLLEQEKSGLEQMDIQNKLIQERFEVVVEQQKKTIQEMQVQIAQKMVNNYLPVQQSPTKVCVENKQTQKKK